MGTQPIGAARRLVRMGKFEWALEDLLRDLATAVPGPLEPPRDLRARVRRARTRWRRRVALALLVAPAVVAVARMFLHS